MLQVLPHQQQRCQLSVLGGHHLPSKTPRLSFKEFTKLCKTDHPDGKPRVFHARRNDEMIQALLAKKIYGARIKIAFTSTAQRNHSRFTKMLMGQMDSIISTCKAAESYLKKSADIIIPHGIDTNLYQPAEDRALAWKNTGYPGERGIGVFGRIRSSKGIDTFVSAVLPVLLAQPDITAIICGETLPKFAGFQAALEQKISAEGLTERCIFIGKQPFSKLPELFRACSIVVAASRNEGFGLTVLEAMSSGTPVVATEAGAWKEIIKQGETGYCVPVDNVEMMSEKISLLLSEDIDLLGKAARQEILQHYGVEKEADALCQHLLSLRNL